MSSHIAPGVLPAPPAQALAALRQQGRRLLFVTNNSSKSRQQYVKKFASLGFEAHPDEVGARGLYGADCCAARPRCVVHRPPAQLPDDSCR